MTGTTTGPALGFADFLRLLRWSISFHWAHNPRQRRRARSQVIVILRRRLARLYADDEGGTEMRVVQALWLGATLHARLLVRRIGGRRRRFHPWRLLLWLVGRGNLTGAVAAYLSWTWVRRPAGGVLWERQSGSM